jgi:hypothetical protein
MPFVRVRCNIGPGIGGRAPWSGSRLDSADLVCFLAADASTQILGILKRGHSLFCRWLSNEYTVFDLKIFEHRNCRRNSGRNSTAFAPTPFAVALTWWWYGISTDLRAQSPTSFGHSKISKH